MADVPEGVVTVTSTVPDVFTGAVTMIKEFEITVNA